MANETILSRVREAIFAEFGQIINESPAVARAIIEESTFTGEDDPGGWSPHAAVVIHCETGIPNGAAEMGQIYERWFLVSDRLGRHYCEHVNGAVIAVYPS